MANQYINVTPTFEQATRMLIAVLLNGNAKGRREASEELLRYARELDRLKEASGAAFGPEDTTMEGE